MRSGAGRLDELPKQCRLAGMRQPLLVTDAGLLENGLANQALEANTREGLNTAVFSSVKSNPVGRNVDDGVEQFRSGRHDGVIALGGGSVMDTAKAIALMAGQNRPLWDFEDAGRNWQRADPEGVAASISDLITKCESETWILSMEPPTIAPQASFVSAICF